MSLRQTLAEKILSQAAARPVRPGDLVVVPVDMAMAVDSIAPSVIAVLRQELGASVRDPRRVAIFIDHVAPAANVATADAQVGIRRFVAEEGITQFYDVGRGVCHQVLLEERLAQPGQIVLGSDSHSTSYGAVWQPLAQTARGDQVALVVDARVTPGGYTVQTAGPLPAGQTPVTVTVAGRQRAFDPPAGLQPVGAIFSETVELIGYALQADSAATVVPGQTVHLRLVWRAQQRVGQHYTVFTHLVDEQGRLWGQHDKLPGQKYSTLFWAPGEVVEDDYSLPVDPVAPSGTYRLVAGLYQALSGARAPIRGAQGRLLGDQLVLAEIEVVAR